ncbi:hypothetical protein [Streptomyces sp. JJ36]|uniref:hypothetical protein n=1 Tax=Streptomyces sp. JJ36 TaxID=2736645 RepID=UPI001F4625F0|nr:hypothetical protein [Streptomyces sp. JJ36]MCF6523634.1 hypothetical protein [Streptomyces sp. JJ36]
MGPDQARHVDALLRAYGIEGVVAPTDPEDTAGAWAVYDKADPDTRQDITADVLATVARHVQPDAPERSGPTRGFVIPPKGEAA